MSGDDPNQRPKKPGPLWHYMRSMAMAPPPTRGAARDELPPREITEADLEPLRDEAYEWRPVAILERFGPARRDAEHTGKLLVACAVLQGPHRVLEMADRLHSMHTALIPRARQMIEDDNLEARKGVLEDLLKSLNGGRRELVATRARAANDLDAEVMNPDGLRLLDLHILASQVDNAVLAQEVTSRRNVTGIDFGRAVAMTPPQLDYAEEWLDRVLGNAELHGILLYWPPEYARVLVVFEDGRLAYDPGASPEDPA